MVLTLAGDDKRRNGRLQEKYNNVSTTNRELPPTNSGLTADMEQLGWMTGGDRKLIGGSWWAGVEPRLD